MSNDETGEFEKIGSGLSNLCGSIIYGHERKKIALYWEMSGVPKYDILLAPVDLRHWDEPYGEMVPQHEQIEILHKLRSWTKSQGIRSDIDLPLDAEIEDVPCLMAECNGLRIRGSAYCSRHYDENLLRQ